MQGTVIVVVLVSGYQDTGGAAAQLERLRSPFASKASTNVVRLKGANDMMWAKANQELLFDEFEAVGSVGFCFSERSGFVWGVSGNIGGKRTYGTQIEREFNMGGLLQSEVTSGPMA